MFAVLSCFLLKTVGYSNYSTSSHLVDLSSSSLRKFMTLLFVESLKWSNCVQLTCKKRVVVAVIAVIVSQSRMMNSC